MKETMIISKHMAKGKLLASFLRPVEEILFVKSYKILESIIFGKGHFMKILSSLEILKFYEKFIPSFWSVFLNKITENSLYSVLFFLSTQILKVALGCV